MKILKKGGGGSREKGGGGNEIHTPCACAIYIYIYVHIVLQNETLSRSEFNKDLVFQHMLIKQIYFASFIVMHIFYVIMMYFYYFFSHQACCTFATSLIFVLYNILSLKICRFEVI